MKYIILTAAFFALSAEEMVAALGTCDHVKLAEEISALNSEKLVTVNEAFNANNELSTTKQDLADALELNEKHQAVIEELSSAPKTILEKATDKVATFIKDGVEYTFSLPAIIHNGVRITPVEVMADTDLQGELIKIKSGMISAK